MKIRLSLRTVTALLILAPAFLPAQDESTPLRVAATTTDLGALARRIGGDAVNVTVFAKGLQDPHFLEARPSFVRELFRADLYLQVGLGLESGWAPVVLAKSRNSRIQPGAPGHLDASSVVASKILPDPALDRSSGHFHAEGNPHFLLDPLQGYRVAVALRDRLTQRVPGSEAEFRSRLDTFTRELAVRFLGEDLGGDLTASSCHKILLLASGPGGTTAALEFLESRDLLSRVGGWLRIAKQLDGTRVIGDHDHWGYFARRFLFEVVDHLEPIPGQAPNTRHLEKIIEIVRGGNIRAILFTSSRNQRHARVVQRATGIQILEMAPRVESLPSAGTYLDMVDHNIQTLERLLKSR